VVWWLWAACSDGSSSVSPPPAEPEPAAPVRVDRRTAGPCDPDEMLGALRAGSVAAEGAHGSDALCQGRFGRLVVTDAAGQRSLALLKFERGEWLVAESGPGLGPASCEQISGLPLEVCQEMLTLPR
jgi:hypothetical protein